MTHEKKMKKIQELVNELQDVADYAIVMVGCETDDKKGFSVNNLVKGPAHTLGRMLNSFLSDKDSRSILAASAMYKFGDILSLNDDDDSEGENESEEKEDCEITVAKIPVDSDAGKKLMELVKGFENA